MINIMYDTALNAWTWYEPQVDQNLPKQLIIDNGAPDRHGGLFGTSAQSSRHRRMRPGRAGNVIHSPAPAQSAQGKPATCRANYLFLDGHAETLPSDVALRALVNRNW